MCFFISCLLKQKTYPYLLVMVNPDINREYYAEPKVELTGTKEGAQELTEESKQILRNGYPKHNALWDARVIKMCYDKLTGNN